LVSPDEKTLYFASDRLAPEGPDPIWTSAAFHRAAGKPSWFAPWRAGQLEG
jgi:hypothetical protein